MLAGAWALLLTAGYAIQPPGQFHGGEAIALDGERWLALRMAPRAAGTLVPATMRVVAIEDPLLDEPGQRTGQAVSADTPDEGILAFLRGPSLAPGVLAEADLEFPDGDGRHRIDLGLVFGQARYRLWSDCVRRDTPRPDDGQETFDCRIVLRAPGGREQVLVRMGGYASGPGEHAWLGDDAAAALLFAGDLDRDGRLDLIFDTSDHYNVSRPTLFLSSQAASGELVHQVAQFESTGC